MSRTRASSFTLDRELVAALIGQTDRKTWMISHRIIFKRTAVCSVFADVRQLVRIVHISIYT